jgi:hypothetical protein
LVGRLVGEVLTDSGVHPDGQLPMVPRHKKEGALV